MLFSKCLRCPPVFSNGGICQRFLVLSFIFRDKTWVWSSIGYTCGLGLNWSEAGQRLLTWKKLAGPILGKWRPAEMTPWLGPQGAPLKDALLPPACAAVLAQGGGTPSSPSPPSCGPFPVCQGGVSHGTKNPVRLNSCTSWPLCTKMI